LQDVINPLTKEVLVQSGQITEAQWKYWGFSIESVEVRSPLVKHQKGICAKC
jgi:hypothetical protein